MSTHSSILAWRIPWEFRIKKPGGFQPIGWQRTNTETHTQKNVQIEGLIKNQSLFLKVLDPRKSKIKALEDSVTGEVPLLGSEPAISCYILSEPKRKETSLLSLL